MILGVHASVRRGLETALDEAVSLDCRALQILPYPRHHAPTDEELSSFRAKRETSRVDSLLIHSRYVPALSSSDEKLRSRSVVHLTNELRLAAALNGDAYVLHAGAYSPGADLDTGVRLFTESVRRAVGNSGWHKPLLLENVPGGGRRMGGTLEDMARLCDALRPSLPALGVCLDTAHAWAAGYDLTAAEGALKLLARAHKLLGFDAVRAFHLNDSRALLGSHVENHWHLGKGRLGVEALRAILQREEFAAEPCILETPKEPGADAENLAFARRLARE